MLSTLARFSGTWVRAKAGWTELRRTCGHFPEDAREAFEEHSQQHQRIHRMAEQVRHLPEDKRGTPVEPPVTVTVKILNLLHLNGRQAHYNGV